MNTVKAWCGSPFKLELVTRPSTPFQAFFYNITAKLLLVVLFLHSLKLC
jgi:hypothetical protein